MSSVRLVSVFIYICIIIIHITATGEYSRPAGQKRLLLVVESSSAKRTQLLSPKGVFVGECPSNNYVETSIVNFIELYK